MSIVTISLSGLNVNGSFFETKKEMVTAFIKDANENGFNFIEVKDKEKKGSSPFMFSCNVFDERLAGYEFTIIVYSLSYSGISCYGELTGDLDYSADVIDAVKNYSDAFNEFTQSFQEKNSFEMDGKKYVIRLPYNPLIVIDLLEEYLDTEIEYNYFHIGFFSQSFSIPLYGIKNPKLPDIISGNCRSLEICDDCIKVSGSDRHSDFHVGAVKLYRILIGLKPITTEIKKRKINLENNIFSINGNTDDDKVLLIPEFRDGFSKFGTVDVISDTSFRVILDIDYKCNTLVYIVVDIEDVGPNVFRAKGELYSEGEVISDLKFYENIKELEKTIDMYTSSFGEKNFMKKEFGQTSFDINGKASDFVKLLHDKNLVNEEITISYSLKFNYYTVHLNIGTRFSVDVYPNLCSFYLSNDDESGSTFRTLKDAVAEFNSLS